MNPYLKIKMSRRPLDIWLYRDFALNNIWPEMGLPSIEKPPISIKIVNELPIGRLTSTEAAYATFEVYLGDTQLVKIPGEKWLGIDEGIFFYTEEVPVTRTETGLPVSGSPRIDTDKSFLYAYSERQVPVRTRYQVSHRLAEALDWELGKAYINWRPSAPKDLPLVPFFQIIRYNTQYKAHWEKPFRYEKECPGVKNHQRFSIRWAFWTYKGFTENPLQAIFSLNLGARGDQPDIYLDPDQAFQAAKKWCSEMEQRTGDSAFDPVLYAKRWNAIEREFKEMLEQKRAKVAAFLRDNPDWEKERGPNP